MAAAKIDVEGILKEMTLEEKVKMYSNSVGDIVPNVELQISLLAGKNFWETVGIERLGVPSLKVGS